MRYQLLNDGAQKTFALILERSDEVMASLQQFAQEQQVTAAGFTALGAFSDCTVGFYDLQKKEYLKIPFHEQMEVLSVIGDISVYQDNPQLHVHVVLGRADGTAHGGHLLNATVNPTLELIITEHPAYLRRQLDPAIGIPLIRIASK